jgi:hypothetical protein
MTATFKTVRLVVSELGAHGDRWADTWQEMGRPVLHLVQQPAENIADFAMRVREALEALNEAGRFPEKAVVLGGGGIDPDTLFARQFALRVILTSMVRQGGGDVLLAADGRDRFAMQSLASTAREMVHGTGVSVRMVEADAAIAAA